MAAIKTTTDPSKNLTVHTITGKITAEEIVTHINTFYSSGKFTKNALWDFTEAEGEEITGDQIMKIAQARKKFDKIRKGGKTALVFPGTLGTGWDECMNRTRNFLSYQHNTASFIVLMKRWNG